MRTPVRFALVLSFCCLAFSGWSQLNYKRPISFTASPRPNSISSSSKTPASRLKLPGCAQTSKQFRIDPLALYKVQHPRMIRFTWPEALVTHTIVSKKTARCFSDVYYYEVIVGSSNDCKRPESLPKPLSVQEILKLNMQCWVPVEEIPPLFHYTPIISTILPGNSEFPEK